MDRRTPLLSEHEMRTQLSNVYAAMVQATRNAQLLADRDPEMIADSEMGGTGLIRSLMEDACDWLEDVRAISRDERTFNDVILNPVKAMAKYLVSIRGAKSTAPLDVWVFQKSEERDNIYGTQVALAMVSPHLESCVSMRMSADEACDLNMGYYKLGSVTPMPHTNRLHPTRNSVAGTGIRPELAGWDFLKISFVDRGKFSDSLEMDSYCEVATAQSDRMHHLGAPVILAGTVVSVDESTVSIRGIIDKDESVTMIRPIEEPPSECRPEDMVGKAARFLSVEWYQPNMQKPGEARRPEFVMCESGSRNDLMIDDLIGYVRMRGRVSSEDVRARYGQIDVSGIPCLSEEGGYVTYASATPAHDPVVSKFRDAVESIRETWHGRRTDCGTPVRVNDVVSEERAYIAVVTRMLERRPHMKNTLSDILARRDFSGDWALKSEYSGEHGLKRHVRHLAWLGLVKTDGDLLTVTDAGRESLGASLQGEIERSVYGKDCVYLPEVSRAPLSLVLDFLRGNGDFEALQNEWGRNRLIWVRRDSEPDSRIPELKDAVAKHRSLILERIRTVNHEINPKFIHDELAAQGHSMGHVLTEIVLEQLETIGHLSRSGEGWEYDLYWRVRSLMEGERDRKWTLSDVAGALVTPKSKEGAVRGVIARIEQEGLAAGLSDGVWMWKRDGADPVRTHAMGLIKEGVMSALGARKRGADISMLEGMVHRHLIDKMGSRMVGERKRLIGEAISELISERRVEKRDGMYYVVLVDEQGVKQDSTG